MIAKHITGAEMRAFTDENGERRIRATLRVEMTLDDIIKYLLSAIHVKATSVSAITDLNKRELLRLAKEQVWERGVKAPLEDADKIDLDDEAQVRKHVTAMFVELA